MSTHTTTESVIKRSTPASFKSVCQRLPEVCKAHQFGVLGEIDLHEKINGKGFDFEPRCKVFEVCNPEKAHNVLKRNLDISSSLPCRISVYTENDLTVISTLRPTLQLGLYRDPGPESEAEEVEQTLTDIIGELSRYDS